jgi:hypothetical protein
MQSRKERDAVERTPDPNTWEQAMGPNSLEKKLLDPRQLAEYVSPTGEVVRVRAEIGWNKLAPQEAATTLSSKELLDSAIASPASGGREELFPSAAGPPDVTDGRRDAFQFGQMHHAAEEAGAASRTSQPVFAHARPNWHRRNWRKTRRRRADEESDSSGSR